MLTVAYLTNRLEPHFDWFFDSLFREVAGQEAIRVVVIDFWAQAFGGWTEANVQARQAKVRSLCKFPDLVHVPPKPTVWQGPHRLTKSDYFAAANARNTALCYAPDGWIAFVDDLVVLLPGWFDQVCLAAQEGYIALGRYAKPFKLQVRDGLVESFLWRKEGEDERYDILRKEKTDDNPVECGGSYMFGCSFAGPVSSFLSINGFDEMCDGCGAEDVIAGMMLEKRGERFCYCPKMLTYESEEGHFQEPQFLQWCKPMPPFRTSIDYLVSSVAASYRVLPERNLDLKALRRSVLAGNGFYDDRKITLDWRDNQPLSEL